MARYDYILWDWNGTLVDDLDANIAIINSLLCQRGLPMLTKEHYRHIFKFPIKIYITCEVNTHVNVYPIFVKF